MVLRDELDIEAELTETEKYLVCLAGTPGYSIAPHARRPQRAELTGIHTRMDARIWVDEQFKENLKNSDRTHERSLGDMADVFARAFTLKGDCLLPLFIASTMGRE